ncbi:MAG: DUF5615 family PIN-like protein [Planctomycetota bacterium]|nr:DUF5615 family PIN-like protein [Planctomycetota bacterium]
MTLRDFALLTDESVHYPVVAFLRGEGFDVLDVKEAGLRGAPDAELLRLALEQHRVMVAHDRDFGRLAIAAMQPIVGLLFLRPGHIRPEFTVETIRAVLAADIQLQVPFIVVAERSGDDVKIRVRQG